VIRSLLHFHDFELDPAQFELRRAGHRIHLERKPLEVLILLAEKQGQLVAREEIIERVWGKDFFFDAERGVNNIVRKIRATLHDDPERPRFVETVVARATASLGRSKCRPSLPSKCPRKNPRGHNRFPLKAGRLCRALLWL